jgi:hypothetical protein
MVFLLSSVASAPPRPLNGLTLCGIARHMAVVPRWPLSAKAAIHPAESLMGVTALPLPGEQTRQTQSPT